MIELERHIEILLLSNDCVIIPGFGGFMAHHVEAYYDEFDKIYFPPTRTIGFNPQLRLNDSLLVQSYIEAFDISYPDAIKRIEQEVGELKQRIEIKGKYEMNGIGILGINKEGKYYFEPYEAGILTPEFYGLGVIELLPLKHESMRVQTINMPNIMVSTNGTQIIGEPTNEEKKMETLPYYDTEENERDTYREYVKKSMLHYIVAILIAIGIFFIFSSPLNTQFTLINSGTHLNTSLLYHILPKDYTTIPILSKIDLNNKKGMRERKVTENVQKLSGATYYTIVMASHISLKNAQKYACQLRKRGFGDVHVYTRYHKTKVIFGKYENKTKACNVLNKLNNNFEFSNCWITTIVEE